MDATPDHTSSALIVSDLLCTSTARSSAMINPLGGDSSICSLEKEPAAEQHKEHHQKQLKVGNPNNNKLKEITQITERRGTSMH